MKLYISIFAVFIVAACILRPAPVVAEFYRYNDKDGVEHITNDFNQIPAEYQEQFLDKSEPKKSNEVINAEEELAQAVAAAKSAQAPTSANETEAEDNDEGPKTILQRIIEFADGYNALLPLQIAGVVAAIIAIFVVGVRIGGSLGHKKLAALICFALAAFVLTYLFSFNIQRVSDSFYEIRGKVKELETKLNSRQSQAEKRLEIPGEQTNEDAQPRQLSPVAMPD
ncbi:MAG: hypothetical protein A3J24_04130 [Deltaproteobacteria bacterium RIFCSPLOWO2_02_FULL_53_8]|nr:MAG: hypothetical protein A3J24_04130 [Deltaproteobacteria bacterium RIFCSPLOWO2_02_FULL_53_8]